MNVRCFRNPVRYWAAGWILLLAGLLAGLIPAAEFSAPSWAVFVQRALRSSDAPRFKNALEKARYVMNVVGDEMNRIGISPNTDAGGRLKALVTAGDASFGNCSTADAILQEAFAGAGFADYQAFQVIGEPSGTAAKIKAGVNRNHVGVGLVLEGKLHMFDLWEHAYRTGTWAGSSAGRFAGIPFSQWVKQCEIYNLFWWENARTKNMTPGMLGGTDKRGRTAAEAEQDIMLDFNTGKKANDATAARNAKAAAVPAPGERPGAAVPHWELIDRVVDKMPCPPEERLDVQGGDGSLTVHWVALDGSRKPVYGADSQMIWSFTGDTGRDTLTAPKVLLPGKKLSVLITLKHKTDGNYGAGSTVACVWPGGSRELAHLEAVPTESPIFQGELSKRGSLVVPFGDKPSEKMQLRFTCSNSQTGTAAVGYYYEWTMGRTPAGSLMTAGGAWEGTWNSAWGAMSFQVQGNRVTGTYAHKQGQLDGELSADGLRLKGRWQQEPSRQPPKDAGIFEFTLAPDGKTFSGHWWYGLDATAAASGKWNGEKAR